MNIDNNITIFTLMFNQVGTFVEIVTRDNLRYEGKLYSLNQKDSTIYLKNTRCYGTEGRPTRYQIDAFQPQHKLVMFQKS